MRDHLLGWPGLLALIEPEARPARFTVREYDYSETVAEMKFRAHPCDPHITEADCRQIKLNGAAQAPQSESERAKEDGRRDVSSAEPVAATPEAAPPSGKWVLTSERKPPIGMHKTRPVGLTRNSWERYFNGSTWSVEQGSYPCTEQNREWFEPQVATPQPDADGWIEHDGGECPVAAGTQVEVMLRMGSKHKGRALIDLVLGASQWVAEPPGEEHDCLRRVDITHYRVVPA